VPYEDKVKATEAGKYPVILDWVKESNASVIHLIRKNPVKAIVSHFTAKKRRMYHTTSKVKKVTIRLSPKKLRREAAKRLYEIEKYRRLFKHQDYHELNYESFMEDRDDETHRILDFLGIDEFVSLRSNLVKQNPDSLEDILENFQEIKKAFQGSIFEKYLVM
jgi:LPS sulfotransferase NodH